MDAFSGINPFVKILFLLSFSVVFIVGSASVLMLVLAGFALFVWMARFNVLKKRGLVIFILVFFPVSTLATILLAEVPLLTSMSQAAVMSVKWLIIMSVAYGVVERTSPSEIIYVTRRLSKSPAVWLPVAVAVRSLPKTMEDSQRILLALKARGCPGRRRKASHVVLLVEAYMFAFLSSFILFLLDLSMVLRLKGVSARNRKTFYRRFRLGARDFAVGAYCGVVIGFSVYSMVWR